MANEWNVSYPLDHTLISDVPGEIRKLKDSVKDQLDREHETPVDGDATGSEHSSGSAVAYEGAGTPTNRPDGATALANNAIDRGRIWLDDNFDPPLLKRWTGSAFEVVGPALSALTDEDADTTAMLTAHAYKATSDGEVSVHGISDGEGREIKAYIGADNDPEGTGDIVRHHQTYGANAEMCFSFLVAKNEYFEIVGTNYTVTILWRSFGTLSKPADQD